MRIIEKAWYDKRHIWVWLLLPLMCLFACISALRRLAFRHGLLSKNRVAAPVIVVGNISVGGTGKTPLVIFLCDFLRQQGYHPGVVSRGYGGKLTQYPGLVTASSTALEVGDEPLLINNRVNCPVVVDPDRSRGAQYLVDKHKCDLIICDDGLQHYRLQRDIEIALLDGQRRLGNGQLVPVGPLREGPWRLQQVDLVVNNGGPVQQGEHLMSLQPGQVVNVKYGNQSQSLKSFTLPVIAAAGIGNPSRFFATLKSKGVRLKKELAFVDHHKFTAGDLPDETVLMTEKDAVKCANFASERWWYLPVNAVMTEEFKQALLKKLRQCKA